MEIILLNPSLKEFRNMELVLRGKKALGIEVTSPDLARLCLAGNIDPQHTEGKNMAAIEIAKRLNPLPEYDSYATIKPDLDSIGSMAILELRKEKIIFNPETLKRIRLIANADTFNHGPWPGERDFPDLQKKSDRGPKPISVIASAMKDQKSDPQKKLKIMTDWLLTGYLPEEYIEQAAKDSFKMYEILKNGQAKIMVYIKGQMVLVESTEQTANKLGYFKAPVVIFRNPFYRVGDRYINKLTVSQYEDGIIDIDGLLAEMSRMEKNWGRSPKQVLSAQGESSSFSAQALAPIVEKYLNKGYFTERQIAKQKYFAHQFAH